MEASSSCSTPLSVHSRVDFAPPSRPRLRRSVLCMRPSCCTSTASSYFGIAISPYKPFKTLPPSRKRSSSAISAEFERFTGRAAKVLLYSQREAKSQGSGTVLTQHLLLGLIAESGAPDGFLGSGITIDDARKAVRSTWWEDDENHGEKSAKPEASATDAPFSSSTKRVLEAAVEYSRSMRHNFIAPEHIAIGLFRVDAAAAAADRIFKRLGADVNHLAAVAVTRLQEEIVKDIGVLPAAPKQTHDKLKIFVNGVRVDEGPLSQFCVDLTARASEGLIDPVVGRETEVQRIIQILCRRTKNNPILLGEAGVGKTAIAEGLAIRISQGNAPVSLWTKRIMSLDIGQLTAGANERGELEKRVTTLIEDVKNSGDVILFIDEVHTIVGRGQRNKGSNLDIGNLLKPSLARGELQCIASTTIDEYRMRFENDKALERRFQPVLISEPSQDNALEILLGLREKYEAHHKCKYTLEALNAAVYLSARYIPDRHLPDKAIDLIDEAGSKANTKFSKQRKEQNMQNTSVLSESPVDYWQEIGAVQAIYEVVRENKLNKADDKLLGISLPEASYDDKAVVVGPDEIAEVASLWSGVPVQRLSADERKLLVGLEEQLKKRVVGQDEAVSAICRAVKRSRVGLKDPDRPIAAMLFCGPTGVGKTELAKALAACYFGSEANMLRLDMSEYMERHNVSKLIGSPPGYVGYGEGGTLTEAIRRQPFTLLLLDEIEKAHPDIFNILLQILEDGHLTDSQGRRVSFKNALVVMTSNIGSSAISMGRHKSIGFLLDNDEITSYAGLKSLVMEEVKVFFRPELLNRVDEIVVFQSLKKSQMHEILNQMLVEVKGRLQSLGVSLKVSEEVLDLVCKQGFESDYGARPLRRAVTTLIEDLLSEAILSGNYKPGDTAIIHLDDSKNPVVSNHSSQTIYLSDTASFL